MADPKEYNDEKDKRSPGLFRPALGGFKPDSKGPNGLFDSTLGVTCEPGRLVVVSRSCSTAGSPTALSSIVPSSPMSPSLESMALGKFVGRRELAGLYIEDDFVAGGGMEMLALPILPPIVPTSAKRLFRFGRLALLGADSSECEGTRPVDASAGPGLEELGGEVEVEAEAEADLSVIGSCVSASNDAGVVM